MLHLIPRPLHRAALRWAHRTRHHWRRIVKPRLAGVSMIAANEAGEVLLVRHSYGPDIWALPGGGCGRSEDPAEAVRREMREELSVAVEALELVSELSEKISGAPHTAYVFSGRLGGDPVPDQREILDARFFALSDLPANIGYCAQCRLEVFRQRLQQG